MKTYIRSIAASLALAAAIGPASLLAQQGTPPAAAKKPELPANPTSATANAAKLPAAREVLDRYIAAIGGREQILKHSSRRTTGTLEIPAAGLKGEVTSIAAKPNKMLVTIAIPGLGEMRQGFDGTVGWSMDATQGPMLLSGKQLERRKVQADFYNELHDPKSYASMQTVDVVDFGGAKAYKVKLLRASGDSTYELFDTQSGLLVGMITTEESPMGTVAVTTTLGDYKPFGGIQSPTKITQAFATGQQVTMTLNTVEYDAVQPTLFEPPAEIKSLATGGSAPAKPSKP